MARIMIVDDALFMRQMLRGILEEAGHDVVAEAVSGSESVEKYEQVRPDLVTMDIVMPDDEGLDGIGAIREILKKDPKARVIMVSAMGQQEMVVEAIQAGARQFIVKPFEPSSIQKAVKSILG